jgi:hypothetical protein
MKKLVLAMVACVLVSGCNNYSPQEQKKIHIHYIKDERTGLCFAGGNWNYDGALFTNVPCTPEVERMLEPTL